MSKQYFGIVLTTMTYWWAPVTMRVSGDESVRGQLRKTEDGRLECDFPERLVLIANHQVRLPTSPTSAQEQQLTRLRSTPIGSTFGGSPTRPRCMDTSTSSLKSR